MMKTASRARAPSLVYSDKSFPKTTELSYSLLLWR